MNNIITFNKAMNSALSAAGIGSSDIIEKTVLLREGFFETYILTDWLEYDIYVDALSGETVGFDCRPVSFCDTYEILAAEA